MTQLERKAGLGPAAGPLQGVRVIDTTVNVLGPVATQILGDMGAEIIKIETPLGDPNRDTGPSRHPGMSAMHMNVNRNKRSVTLNLKRPESFEVLMRLVEGADVLCIACVRPPPCGWASATMPYGHAIPGSFTPPDPATSPTVPIVTSLRSTTSSRARAV